MDSLLFNSQIDNLATKVEEGSRANKGNIGRFSEPAEGTLRRSKAKRHHLIFGRRGSGKSSLLYKAADDLTKEKHPVALVDLEPFKGHLYPDIIISVLIASFKKYKDWIRRVINSDLGFRSWKNLWLKKKYSTKTVKYKELENRIDNEINELLEQLHLTDNADLKKSLYDHLKNETTEEIKGSIDTPNAGIEALINQAVAKSKGTELQEEFKRNKKEYLLRKIIDYQSIFTDLYQIEKRHSYLFLDDLYHINESDQASLIDFFHKISKGNELWIKIATIRNRTTWYKETPQPIGVKIGDDADEINLDLTLEKFSTTKDFLASLLKRYIQDTNAPELDDILTDGGLDRLVLASGGVTRDFLGLFWRSISEAKERLKRSDGDHHRGPKIGAEDVNIAAGSYGEIKREEFQKDSPEDREELENAFNKVKEFCLEKTKKSIFLYDQEDQSKDSELLKQLIDLRLLHQVKSRVTVRSRTGKIYRAYLLDVSQYTGERARRDVEIIEFWKAKDKDILRLASLIFDPSLKQEKTKSGKKAKKMLQKNNQRDGSDDQQKKLKL